MKWENIKNIELDYGYVPSPFLQLVKAINNNVDNAHVRCECDCLYNEEVKYVQVIFKSYKAFYKFCRKYHLDKVGMLSIRWASYNSTKRYPCFLFSWQHRSEDAILENINGLARAIGC